jgi:DNA polymerase-3 subunit gamma/tau
MTSLYRAHRPQQFSDLVGQTPVVATLTQAVARNRVGHAYLFSGPKGSGKTTTARILAMAVNCTNRKEGTAEPCHTCEQCQAIQKGRGLDILEIDAASHRGIEEIRELREAVKFSPSKAKRKVYIIDEVHMLTREAFNALLKTLEEPPPHALFILATTEPHKVPATITSRAQHFLFRRAGIPDLVVYLSKIARKEKIAIEEDALKLIAATADGSFRDAVSSLEQVWAAHPKKNITDQDVVGTLGLAERAIVFDFLFALAERDLGAGMRTVSELAERGFDLFAFLRAALDLLRALLLMLAGEEKLVQKSYTDEDRKRLAELASLWGPAETVQAMEALIAAGVKAKSSPIPELVLEMVVAEMGDRQPSTSEESDESPKGEKKTKEETRSEPSTGSRQRVAATAAVPVAKAIEKIDDTLWQSVLAEVKEANASLYSILKEAIVLGQTADGIALGVRFRFHAELLAAAKNQLVLTQAVSSVLGRPAAITVEVKPEVFSKQEEELLKMAEELL